MEISKVKPGAVITFVYGPGEAAQPKYAVLDGRAGKAYGTKLTQWGWQVRVKMPDFTFETVTYFVEKGIGAYYWG